MQQETFCKINAFFITENKPVHLWAFVHVNMIVHKHSRTFLVFHEFPLALQVLFNTFCDAL